MMRKTLAAALFAAATPLTAIAQTCPTNSDLSNGVRLTRSEPFLSIVQTQTAAGLSEVRVTSSEAQTQEMSSLFAHPVLVSERISETETLTLTYDRDTAGIDRINRTNSWMAVVTLGLDGRTVDTGQLFVHYLGPEKITIGDCTYDVWILQEELTLSRSDTITAQKFYAPNLGLVLGTIQLNSDGTARSSVFFDEITAE